MSERESWACRPGDEVVPGRFVEKRLGGGRSTEVYLASGHALTDPVVVKVLRPDRCTDRGRRKLAREGSVLEDLDHPAIPRLVDAHVDAERPHLLLEFVEGPRLSSVVRRRGALPVDVGRDLARRLCEAVDHIHARGYVHLDVKPSNVVLGPPPRLIDLSVARTFEAARALRSTVGTDAYMAPEQCEPQGSVVGPAADVWGLGATLWEALTGERPFPRTGDERFPQLRGSLPTPPRSLPRPIRAVLRSCLRPDPERRPTVAELGATLGGRQLSG